MQFNVGFKTDIGRKRQQNQDNGGAFPELGLFVVADGMGGHKGGETASAMVVEILPQVVREGMKGKSADPRRVLADAIRKANRAIFEASKRQTDLQGMGTTTTAILAHGGRVILGHVGDSRCYYFRPECIWQVTRDHSLVQEKLRAGLITREQLKTDRMKNVITRSVGFEEQVDVETYDMKVQPGDVFMLCSDGLSGLVDDPDVLEIVQKQFFKGGDPQRAVDQLIEAANARGGDDNITSILVQVAEL
ncbi:MAG TPA: Stp1/IreP family PP2C-type Ser/Thr phosphatase [Bdellovibrionota bacterium]|jgi:protein phosphatase|nr:Stp1/IreP family PP2C-type Ser/Thr phosphatase [Bdellovibrionota bacterium]